MIGLGIDESSALWVKPNNEAEVLGEKTVIYIDPGGAKFYKQKEIEMLTAQNMKLSVFQAGDKFTLPENK
jgi:cyanophycinase-like exopeptidase